jgi:hypothetical protein
VLGCGFAVQAAARSTIRAMRLIQIDSVTSTVNEASSVLLPALQATMLAPSTARADTGRGDRCPAPQVPCGVLARQDDDQGKDPCVHDERDGDPQDAHHHTYCVADLLVTDAVVTTPRRPITVIRRNPPHVNYRSSTTPVEKAVACVGRGSRYGSGGRSG